MNKPQGNIGRGERSKEIRVAYDPLNREWSPKEFDPWLHVLADGLAAFADNVEEGESITRTRIVQGLRDLSAELLRRLEVAKAEGK